MICTVIDYVIIWLTVYLKHLFLFNEDFCVEKFLDFCIKICISLELL